MFILLDSPLWMQAAFYTFASGWGLATLAASIITGAVCGYHMWALSTSQGTLIGIATPFVVILATAYLLNPFRAIPILSGGMLQAVILVLCVLAVSGLCYLLNRRAGPRPEVS